MKSRFDSSRIFNDSTGWFVVMRESDKKIIVSMKFNLVGKQHIMGPFPAKIDVENWLEGYLAVHSQNRPDGFFNSKKVATYA